MKLDKVPRTDYVTEEHGPVYNFLYSYKTNFITLMGTNLLFIVFNIPMMLVAFAYVLIFLPMINPVFVPENFVEYTKTLGIIGNTVMQNDVGSDAAYQLYYLIVIFSVMFLMGTTLICFGPFHAGFSQVYRNLYRETGLFYFSDFKEGMKSNLKQSLGAMFISLIVTALTLTGIGFYGASGSRLGTAVSVFFIVIFCVFIMVQNMVWQMIVSVDLPLKKIYRNAILFVLLKFGPCLGLIGISFLLLVLIPFLLLFAATFVAYAVVIFFYLTFVLSFIQYMNAYATGVFIKQYIGSPNEYADDDPADDIGEAEDDEMNEDEPVENEDWEEEEDTKTDK